MHRIVTELMTSDKVEELEKELRESGINGKVRKLAVKFADEHLVFMRRPSGKIGFMQAENNIAQGVLKDEMTLETATRRVLEAFDGIADEFGRPPRDEQALEGVGYWLASVANGYKDNQVATYRCESRGRVLAFVGFNAAQLQGGLRAMHASCKNGEEYVPLSPEYLLMGASVMVSNGLHGKRHPKLKTIEYLCGIDPL